jgi:uncharacterized protein
MFIGPAGAGKTTAIARLAETAPFESTAERAPGMQAQPSALPMVTDHAELRLPNGEVTHLYGIDLNEPPGLLLSASPDAPVVGVLLLDHRRHEALNDLRTGLETYSALACEAALVIGVGHMHQDSVHGLDAYYDVLEQRGLRLPVLSVDVRKRSDVLLLLELLIASREARTGSAS